MKVERGALSMSIYTPPPDRRAICCPATRSPGAYSTYGAPSATFRRSKIDRYRLCGSLPRSGQQSSSILARDSALKSLGARRGRSDHYSFAPLFTDVIEQAAEVGLFGINRAERHAGIDMDAAMVAVILEKLCEEEC